MNAAPVHQWVRLPGLRLAQPARWLALLGVLAAGLVLARLAAPAPLRPARWPTSDAVYAVPGWGVGPAIVQVVNDPDQTSAIVQRTYTSPAGEAVLTLWTTPAPQGKTLLRKGPDRDYLGGGYLTEPVPAAVARPVPGGGMLIVRRGADAWLLVYAFGERRGLLGSGVRGWTWATLDSLLGARNDAFMVRLALPFRGSQQPPSERGATLATTLFPRLAGWYAR